MQEVLTTHPLHFIGKTVFCFSSKVLPNLNIGFTKQVTDMYIVRHRETYRRVDIDEKRNGEVNREINSDKVFLFTPARHQAPYCPPKIPP